MHRVILCAAAAVFISNQAVAQEKIPFPSIDGDLKGGTPTTITGYLYKPAASGPFAAVVSMPGCDGVLDEKGEIHPLYGQWGRIPLVGDKFLDKRHIKGVLLASDPSLPLHLASQDCDVAQVVDAKGAPLEGYGGYCVTIDKDGDVYWIRLSSTATDYTWTVVSGIGKYADMTGNGATKILMAAADGRLTLALSGTLNMK